MQQLKGWPTIAISKILESVVYGCRNGAKFNILKFYSYLTCIHSYLTFVSIQHYYLFKIQHLYLYSTVLFVHNIIIHSETIHSTTFYSFKIYCASLLCMEVTYFLQRMNRGSEEAQAIIGTLKRHRPLLH